MSKRSEDEQKSNGEAKKCCLVNLRHAARAREGDAGGGEFAQEQLEVGECAAAADCSQFASSESEAGPRPWAISAADAADAGAGAGRGGGGSSGKAP